MRATNSTQTTTTRRCVLWKAASAWKRFGELRRLASKSWLMLAALSFGPSSRAYPPSPYHLVYGMVRDQYGAPVMNSQAKVFLVSATGSQTSAFIQPGLAIDVNYQLRVPMDTFASSDAYRSTVLTPGTSFTMYVVTGNITNTAFMSVGNTATLGQPTKMTHIDLTVGADKNHDGIPDAWELQFVASLGLTLTLADLNASLDLAHNGRTLLQEYLLATSTDPAGSFSVRMEALNDGAVILSFPASTGKTYSVLGSANLEQWSAIPFRLSSEGNSGATRTNYTTISDQTLQIQIVPSGSAALPQFFKIGRQ